MPSDKKPIAVRLDDETRQAVEELAEKYRVSSATIGIWALEALLEYVRMNNGKVVLPLSFEDLPNRQINSPRNKAAS